MYGKVRKRGIVFLLWRILNIIYPQHTCTEVFLGEMKIWRFGTYMRWYKSRVTGGSI